MSEIVLLLSSSLAGGNMEVPRIFRYDPSDYDELLKKFFSNPFPVDAISCII